MKIIKTLFKIEIELTPEELDHFTHRDALVEEAYYLKKAINELLD
jgi:hypothetical protein